MDGLASGRRTIIAVAAVMADEQGIRAECSDLGRDVPVRQPGHERLQNEDRRRQHDQRTLQLAQGCDEFAHDDLSCAILAYYMGAATSAPARRIADDMANRESAFEITPEVLLKAYACGIFPMAESAEDPSLHWLEPDLRGIIPLDRFYVSSRLARTVRSDQFQVTINRDFDGVIDGCAEPQVGRPRTWINDRIRTLYRKLHDRRHCHSIEVWVDGDLVGGLYGVALGRAFFGESMFHRVRDASKVALVHLVARLRVGGFTLLDTQFVTDHLKTFGAIEVPRRQYHKLLEAALVGEGDFTALDKRVTTGAQVLSHLAQI